MKLKKLFATLILFFILFNTIVPVINYSVASTGQEDDEEIEQEYDEEEDDDDQEIGEEYEIKSEETWDVSEKQDGSVIAKWTMENKTLTISGNGNMKYWNSWSDKGDWHGTAYTNVIEKVVIENGINNIGFGAFEKCSNISIINIPSSINTIEDSVFDGCKGLKTIKVNANNNAYADEDGILYNKEKTEIIQYPQGRLEENFAIPNSVTTIKSYAFKECSNLKNITIPTNVKKIQSYAFEGCRNLISINIPYGVTTIGAGTFTNCSSLISVNIPNSVTSIEMDAFSDCSSLTNIGIPNGVTSIGWHAFEFCESLTSIKIPDSVTNIGSGAFEYCSNLSHIEISNSLISIEEEVFNNCSELVNIEIPNSVTSIGSAAFYECSSLKNITIPTKVKVIDFCAFYGCKSLTSVNIPSGVTKIGDIAFAGCSNLMEIKVSSNNQKYIDEDGVLYNKQKTEIIQYPLAKKETHFVIPNSVQAIKERTFEGNSNLNNVTVPNTTTSIDDDAFYKWNGLIVCKTNSEAHRFAESKKIYYILTDDIESQYDKTYALKDEEIWDVSEDKDGSVLAKWTSKDRTLTISGNGKIKNWSIEKEDWHNTEYTNAIEKVIIENGITHIGSSAFANCTNLTSINISSSVISISSSALSITQYTYYENRISSLTEIIVDENNTKFSSVDGILYNKEKTKIIKYPEGRRKNTFSVPSGIKDIGNYAFFACSNLTSIIIPKGVINIEEHAFDGCSNLISIEIPDSVIEIGNWAFTNCNSLISIEIPNGVTNLKSNLFSNCNNLISIKIPESVIDIDEDLFNYIYGIKEINVDENNTEYSSIYGVLYNKEQTEMIYYPIGRTENNFVIPSSVTTIKDNLFMNRSNLKNIEIPNSVTEIGSDVFYGCSNLTSLNIPNSVTKIGNNAFEKCSSLTNIKISENVTEIGNDVFAGCSSLTSINIPNSVTSIGTQAFKECTSLKSINISRSVEIIGENALKKCSNLEQINVDENNREYSSIDGVLYNKDKTRIIKYPTKKEESIYVILNSVTDIDEYAFEECSSLKNVVIPSMVENIPDYAFVNWNGLIICKEDSAAHMFAENNEKRFILDEKMPKVYFTPSDFSKPKKDVSIKLEVVDEISGLDETSLKYVWSTKEQVTKKEVTTSFTNGDIIDSPKGETKTYYLYIYAKDILENEGIIKQTVILDNTPPQLDVSYSEEKITNKDIVVTITANEEVQNIEGWTLSSNGKALSKKYTKNTEETIIVKDIAGNEAEKKVKITNIDKDAPRVTGVQDGEIYSNRATPIAEDKNLESVRLLKKEKIQNEQTGEEEIKENEVENYNNGDEITDFGDYKIIATDKAGNTTIVEFGIKEVLNTRNIVEITKAPEGPTNQDVVVTIAKKQNEEYKDVKVEISTDNVNYIEQEGVFTKTFTENGIIYVRVVLGDEIGEVVEVKVDNIGILNGDLNENSKIDIGDILMLNRHMSQANNNNIYEKHPDWRLSEQKILSGDLNGNKIIDIGDVLKLRRYMAAQNNNEVATKHPDWLNL